MQNQGLALDLRTFADSKFVNPLIANGMYPFSLRWNILHGIVLCDYAGETTWEDSGTGAVTCSLPFMISWVNPFHPPEAEHTGLGCAPPLERLWWVFNYHEFFVPLVSLNT